MRYLILSVPLSLLVSKETPGPHFVQRSVRSRLEFLKKSGHLQTTSFPDLEKDWKIKDKVCENGKKSGEFFVLKTETSALLLSEIFQVVQSYLKFRLWRKHSIKDRQVSNLSYLRQHCIVVTVCSQCIMGKNIDTKLVFRKRN